MPDEPEQAAQTGLLSQFRKLGDARDGLLVAIAVLYILGLASWSFYSWRNDIGFIDILDKQYFLGGFIPSILIIVAYASWRLSPADVDGAARFTAWSFALFFAIIIPLGIFGWWTGYFAPFRFGLVPQGDVSDAAASFIASALMIPVIIGLVRIIRGELIQGDLARSPATAAAALAFFGMVALVGIASALWLYFWIIYPALPDEIGGARPRCAELTLSPEALSGSDLASLGFRRDYSGPIVSAVATARVLYNGDRAMVFAPLAAKVGIPAVEVRKGLVRSIVWLPESKCDISRNSGQSP